VLENGEDATVVTLSELLKEADVRAITRLTDSKCIRLNKYFSLDDTTPMITCMAQGTCGRTIVVFVIATHQHSLLLYQSASSSGAKVHYVEDSALE
jgi:hypothetical protein